MKNKIRKVTNSFFFTLVGGFVLLFPFYTLLAQEFEFDPGNRIKTRLKLPEAEPESITIKVIQWILGLLGLVAVVMIIFGGFMWMTAGGNEEKVKNAKKILSSAVIGLVIILLSWAILTFVVSTVKNVTS